MHNSQMPPKRFKPRWLDPTTGYQLSAGGILFYDDLGFWAVTERDSGNSMVYTDPGGRYTYEDGTIWATIAREVCEETYQLVQLTPHTVQKWAQTSQLSYVRDASGVPAYVCLLVHTTELKGEDAILDGTHFALAREQILKQNPMVPPSYYKTQSLEYIEFRNVASNHLISAQSPKLSFRLKQIVSNFCKTQQSLKSDFSAILKSDFFTIVKN